MRERTVEDEVAEVKIHKPHVVLLGAGASRAAFPLGEASGLRLPLMADFLDIVPVRQFLEHAGIQGNGLNFEQAYSELCSRPEFARDREHVEAGVRAYFESLSLPSTPTIYDQLVLGLRPRDMIATFNWDPFLIQAVQRHSLLVDPPQLVFLHGNVLQGFCEEHNLHGLRGENCSMCDRRLVDVPLLFPIGQKNYESEPAISDAWRAVGEAMKKAFMVTVFGYGAPESDKAALALLQNAWGPGTKREFEQVEIIDVRPEAELRDAWDPFIHSHHYRVHSDFSDSWIAKHPRRTGEAWWNQFIGAEFLPENRVPRFDSVPELVAWHWSLIRVEMEEMERIKAAQDEKQK